MKKQAPNFLFIITDQHRADWLSCYGHPVLKTPHIDQLAAGGTRYDRFYVSCPVCMPNRATLMTGRMPSAHGVRSNGIPLGYENNTFVELLRRNGYQTALAGKSHLQNFTDKKPVQDRPAAINDRAMPDEYFEARKPYADVTEYSQESIAFWNNPGARLNLPFYGFDQVDLTIGHGDQVSGDYTWWLEAQHTNSDQLRGSANALESDIEAPQAWRTRMPEHLYPTAYVAEKTKERLSQMAASEKPFFMMMSFPDPHHPFTPPGRYWDMYRPEDMVMPKSLHERQKNSTPGFQWVHEQEAKGMSNKQGMTVFADKEASIRNAMALTAGMISFIDDKVGEVLDHLEALDVADNTIVVFTSDHGDFLGDHSILLKGPLHYQGLVRVPFIWHDPRNTSASAIDGRLWSTLDIAPSILWEAGVTAFNGMQGTPIQSEASAETVVIEEDAQRQILGLKGTPRVNSLITERYRMTLYEGVEWGELFDLHEDPEEMNNLWEDAKYAGVRSQLMEQLAYKRMGLIDRSPYPVGLG